MSFGLVKEIVTGVRLLGRPVLRELVAGWVRRAAACWEPAKHRMIHKHGCRACR